PGPFGSGKCISGETPVLLGNGEVKAIKQVYEENRLKSEIASGEFEETITLKEPLELFTMQGTQIKRTNINTLYKGKSDYLLRVKLRSGRYTEVTPVHKLFKVDQNLKVQETEAHQLRIGEYLAAPRRIEAKETEAEVNYNTEIKRAKHITIPTTTSPSLGEFLGLFIAEGYIRGNRTVVFTNKDIELRNRFAFLAQSLFGIETKEEKQAGKVENVLIVSIELAKFLEQTCKKGSVNKIVPEFIMRATKETISAFIEAFYEGDGSFYKNEVELSTSSKSLSICLSYLLLQLGVLHGSRKTYRNDSYRIFIRGKENVAKFAAQFNLWTMKTSKLKEYLENEKRTYCSIDPVPISSESVAKIYNESGKPYAELKKQGIEITNYTKNHEVMSRGTLQKFLQVTKTQAFNTASDFLSNFYCDEIIAIEKIEGPLDVYDFVVPETHNFIGGFGAVVLHNTVTQTSLAKYCNAQVIIYVGCGERGNEMTEVLTEFPKLTDPHSGKPLMNRTVLIANTSNMPVAAREASIYTGITIAEYFRDMGYDVALMADSTSRWAEAMREISGRMEEMPGEEGYPAYLNRKLAEFYERTGRITCLSGKAERTGSVTAVGAVSPAGGDLSEPVSQGTLAVTKVFWALDAALARRRHYPAINWLKSYSLYHDDLRQWYDENAAEEFYEIRGKAMSLLQKEAELQSIVQLIGPDALPDKERLVLEVTKMVREDFLQQNAYDAIDATSSLNKQFHMLRTILHFYDKASAALNLDIPFETITSAPEKVDISQLKRVEEKEVEKTCQKIMSKIDSRFHKT
ncbi:V-type ATP synthase subunit A, partial [Candidatus Micrarchaeota archaeon]|nr:V-type ATP synthase subunit A [Candidatus Micrarchaeota archaeon]